MRGLALLTAWLTLPAVVRGREAVPPVAKNAVTQAWLRKLLRDPKRLAGMIDPGRGLVVINHEEDSAAEHFKPRIQSRLLCGKALEAARTQVLREVMKNWKGSDLVGCQNRPGPPRCRFFHANEYTIAVHLLFAPASDRGWNLDAVLFLDGGLLNDPASIRRRDHGYVGKELMKLRRADCAGAPLKGPLPDYARFTSR